MWSSVFYSPTHHPIPVEHNNIDLEMVGFILFAIIHEGAEVFKIFIKLVLRTGWKYNQWNTGIGKQFVRRN